MESFEYIGTIEPRWNDEKAVLTENEKLADDALAFIYGAIKKYGTNPKALKDLKNYIKYMVTKIGTHQQVQTFIKDIMDMREIYPQFKQMTLDEIYEYLNQKETV